MKICTYNKLFTQSFKVIIALSFVLFIGIHQSAVAQTCTVNAGVPFAMCQSDGDEWTLYGNSNPAGAGSVSVTWSIVSQPAGNSASISSPNSETTIVTGITEVGEYVFEIAGVCPDASGTAYDQVKYYLDEPLPDPGLAEDYEFCTSGTISVASPEPDVQYAWIGIEFDSYGEQGMQIVSNGSSVDLSVNRFYPGGIGKLILFSWRGSCVRRDTADVIVTNEEPADAGADVYICGDSWTKTPEFYETLESDEYRFMPYGGTQSWTQISGPSAATINYNSTYTTQTDGVVNWTDLVAGTYEFELTFTYPAPCNTTYTDRVIFYVSGSAPSSCQEFSSSSYVIIGDCDGTLGEWYIDLRDYGIDPDLMEEGDTIRWSFQGTANECAPGFTLPAPNQTVVVMPTTDICSNCRLVATYECGDSPGCGGNALAFRFFNLEFDMDFADAYVCSPDGNPVAANPLSGPIWTSSGCFGSFFRYFRVINSPTLSAGTQIYQPNLGTFLFDLGVHEFEIVGTSSNSYFNSLGGDLQSCEESDPYTITVLPTAQAANAGTDAILPCGNTSTTLSGNNPDLPTFTGASVQWSFVSGPNTPTMSDVNQQDLNLSGLVPGIYNFKYTVGNAVCGFIEDDVNIIVSSALPTANAGADDAICYGGRYVLDATVPTDAVGAWSVSPSAGVSFEDITCPTSYVEGLGASTAYTFTWTTTNGCGSATDDVVITTSATQTDVAEAGSNMCQQGDYTFDLNATAITATGATGLWEVISTQRTPVTFDDPTSPTAVMTVGTSTFSNFTTILKWTVTVPGCDPQVDTLVVTHMPSWLTPSTYFFDFCNYGAADTITSPYFYPSLGILWTQEYEGPAGVQFLSPVDDPELRVIFPGPGQYELYVEYGEADCVIKDKYIVTVGETPASAESAGPDAVVCDLTSYTMQATEGPHGGRWFNLSTPGGDNTISSSSGYSYSDPTDPNATITFSAVSGNDDLAGEYVFVWATLPETYINSQCFLYDTVSINVIESADAGEDMAICEVDGVSLMGNVVAPVAQGAWSYVSGDGTPTQITISDDGRIAAYDFPGAGTYVMEYRITSADCGVTTDQMTITIDLPEPDLGPDIIACLDTLQLDGPTLLTGESAMWELIEGSGSFIGSAAEEDVTFGPLSQGDTLLFAIAITNSSGCIGRDTIQVAVDYFDELNAIPTMPTSCSASDGEVIFFNLEADTDYSLYYLFDGVQQGAISLTSDAVGSHSLTGLSAGLLEDIVFENSSSCLSDTIDAVLLAAPCIQNLGNQVWVDTNVDGILNGTESGIDNVDVYLYEDNDYNGVPDGAAVSSAVTAGGGFYAFDDVRAGAYVVGFDLSGLTDVYYFTPKVDEGSDEEIDSDAQRTTGLTSTVYLQQSNDDLRIDAGIVKPSIEGITWMDTDEDGLRETGEPLLEGVIVYLYDSGDNMIRQSNTFGDGKFAFHHIPAGDYYLVFDEAPNVTKGNIFATATYQDMVGSTTIDDIGDSDVEPNQRKTITFSLSTSQRITDIDAGFSISELPVEFLFFRGFADDCKAQLHWATATEQDNSHFIVEKSTDGRNFQEIGKVDGQGTTAEEQYYSFIDKRLRSEKTYYRLKQVDYDGTYSYSNIAVISLKKDSPCFNPLGTGFVQPNPNFGQFQFIVSLEEGLEGTEFIMTDLLGKQLSISKANLEAGSNQIELDITDFSPGTYFLTVKPRKGEPFSFRIVHVKD